MVTSTSSGARPTERPTMRGVTSMASSSCTRNITAGTAASVPRPCQSSVAITIASASPARKPTYGTKASMPVRIPMGTASRRSTRRSAIA